MPSSAAKTEAGAEPRPQGLARLAAAASVLAARGIIGIAWLDERLAPLDTHGALAAGLPLGVPVTESVPALLGLDDDIRALGAASDAVVAMPNVRLDATSLVGGRVDFAIYRMAAPDAYLLVVSRAVSWSELEYQLAAEVRGRAIAEAEVAAQARLIERANVELATANQDLAEFASVISHDLRAPLRGLRYAATDAGRALASGDVAVAGAEIERVLAQARRMSTMLTGLLDYARAGRKGDAATAVDTGALVREIAGSIGADATHTIAVSGDWPVITTPAEALDIVVRNLIDNAVKHHDRPEGRIEITGEDRADTLFIRVSDDGPGIDPAWHGAIFLPFRKIADDASSDGSGIGLALVKKTVERCGGSIEVHSDPSQARGTTFLVAWPKTQPLFSPGQSGPR